jgi:hypothetical protein
VMNIRQGHPAGGGGILGPDVPKHAVTIRH